jgi:hypothetical protein
MVQTIARWQAWWRGEDVLDRFALSASPASIGVAEPRSSPPVGERFSS